MPAEHQRHLIAAEPGEHHCCQRGQGDQASDQIQQSHHIGVGGIGADAIESIGEEALNRECEGFGNTHGRISKQMLLIKAQQCREHQNHGQIDHHHGQEEQGPGHADQSRKRLAPEFMPWRVLMIVTDPSAMEVKH
ncbi:MAG: hypothetical protein QM522_02360 [Chitinophagaceae bacterium]|nr:hypothetical protein [Chitinophagaceae bacterium]